MANWTEPKPPTLWHVYHSLWGKAHDAPSYQKRDWTNLFREVEKVKDTTENCLLRREIIALALAQGVSPEDVNKFR